MAKFFGKIGYGSAHHTQFVTGPERSGLYYLHAKGEKSGEFFAFPWVVAPAKPSASLIPWPPALSRWTTTSHPRGNRTPVYSVNTDDRARSAVALRLFGPL